MKAPTKAATEAMEKAAQQAREAKASTGATSTPTPEAEPLALPSIDPLYLFKSGETTELADLASARLAVATEGAQFLAALLIQHGIDSDCDGSGRFTACPDWTRGVGAALAAVIDSIQGAHGDLLKQVGKGKG